MRNSILLISLLIFSCKSIQQYAGNTNSLNGNWKPVQQEMNGRALPAIVFQSQLLTIQDSLYTLKAESMDKGILRFAGAQMDIYGKEGVNKDKHFTALYALQKDTLRICYNLKGDAYPTTFTTKGGGLLFLSVFVKQEQP